MLINSPEESGEIFKGEIIDIDYVNKAFERLDEGDVKYRFVVDMVSLES